MKNALYHKKLWENVEMTWRITGLESPPQYIVRVASIEAPDRPSRGTIDADNLSESELVWLLCRGSFIKTWVSHLTHNEVLLI